jgi:hypothetical protein
MHLKKNGYVAGAVLMLTFSKQLRNHVEYEKFLCRVMIDNEETRRFKENTASHKDQIYAFRYNNPATERLTALERNKKRDAK